MSKSLRFVGLDVHKDSIVIAVAEEGREAAYVYADIVHDWPTLRRKLRQPGRRHSLRCCYEAGPCGYGLYRKMKEAKIDMPLFVRAGSIISLGHFLEYSTQKPADEIELRIYAGADGEFVLYEDETDNYNYEKGIYATIPIRWNETRQQLSIGNHQGRFPGMLEDREFHVVWVREGHGTGVGQTRKADLTLRYRGKAITVRRPSESPPRRSSMFGHGACNLTRPLSDKRGFDRKLLFRTCRNLLN